MIGGFKYDDDERLYWSNPNMTAAAAPVPNSKTVHINSMSVYPSQIKPVVIWQYRWTNPGNYENQLADMFDWKPVIPRWGQTIEGAVVELRAYRHNNSPCYEVRALGVIEGL